MEQKEARPWLVRLMAMLLALSLAALGSFERLDTRAGGAVACLGGGTQTRYVVPVGRAVGIKLFARGVMVVGLSEVTTSSGESSPAKDCGLREGDIITHIDGHQVDSIEAVQTILRTSMGEPLSLQVSRNGRHVETEAAAVQGSDGSYKLGAWIRDSMAGIGTITYYDPQSGKFAALGHGINDVDTHLLMPLESGAIMGAEVVDVQAGTKGTPGELHGSFDLEHDLGTLYANTECGVFGVTEEDTFDGQALPVATIEETRVGEATILANVDGDAVREYSVEILRVYRCTGQDSRSMMLRVTDPELLAKTG
ncbi:MAG: PDZ domain-containing protein, partial [Oscillospiraceae bacterium]|nr:PDZ domain-containing protein [Oscillospiraceae bacterium]